MICVSVAHISFSELMKSINDFEMLELRLDLLNFSTEEYQQIIDTKKPVIATFRSEGASENIRSEALKNSIQQGASYIDIELDSTSEYRRELIFFAKENRCKVILSYHNFNETPDTTQLNTLIQEAKTLSADYVKIVTQANSKDDVEKVLSLYENNDNLIAFTMGEIGKSSRVKCLSLGAEFTYASLSNKQATASGQFNYHELKELVKSLH